MAGPDLHPLGTEVLVGHVDRSGGDPGVRTQIGLTVLRVRKGTQRDLASNGLEIDAEDRDSTPFYVDARFANKGGNAVTRNLDVGLEDTDGNLVPPTIIFSFGDRTFRPCPSVSEGMLEPGQSYESCTLVLVPAGLEVGRVNFSATTASTGARVRLLGDRVTAMRDREADFPHLPAGRTPGPQSLRNRRRRNLLAPFVGLVGLAMYAAGVWVAAGGRGPRFDRTEELLGGLVFAAGGSCASWGRLQSLSGAGRAGPRACEASRFNSPARRSVGATPSRSP